MFRIDLTTLHKVSIDVGHGRHYNADNRLSTNIVLDELEAWLRSKNVSILYAVPGDDTLTNFALVFDYIDRCAFYFNRIDMALAFKLKFHKKDTK